MPFLIGLFALVPARRERQIVSFGQPSQQPLRQFRAVQECDTAHQRRDPEQHGRDPHQGPSGQKGCDTTQQRRDSEQQERDPHQCPSGQKGCDNTQQERDSEQQERDPHQCPSGQHGRDTAERGGDRPIQMPLVDALPPTRIVQRVLHHHAEVTRMVAAGYPLSDIARRLQLDRKTIRRYRDTSLDNLISSARDRRPEQLDAFKPYLQQQYAAGVTSGRTLFREIHERGFRGGYSTLTAYLRTLQAGTAPSAPGEIPSPRRITAWIMRNRNDQIGRARV